jgi:Tfp pilus assembly protein PilF
MREERWADAIQLGEAVLAAAPPNWRIRWNLGWAYLKTREYSKAVMHLRVAAELSAESSTCHWALAFALLELGEVHTAEVEFRTALELQDYYLAWQGLALLYLRTGELQLAEETHRRAIQRRPDSRERNESYAHFLSDVGRVQEARAQYKRAATLWPESSLDVQ